MISGLPLAVVALLAACAVVPVLELTDIKHYHTFDAPFTLQMTISLPLAVLVLLAAGAVVPALELTRIKHYTYNNNGHGAYSFEYETSDGSYRHEDGGVSWPGNLIVRGEYGYVDPTGKLHVVKYVADENGFQPLTSGTEDTRFNDRRIV